METQVSGKISHVQEYIKLLQSLLKFNENFHRNRKKETRKYLLFVWSHIRSWIAKVILEEKKKKAVGFILLFLSNYKTLVIRMV